MSFGLCGLTLTGPVRGLGVLGREHFEINPEEVHVNFADVKGVGTQLGIHASL